MYESIILEATKEDLRDAARWYNSQKKGLGNQFLSRIKEKVVIIKQNPYAYQVRYLKIRTAIVEQFPYLVHYYIDEVNHQIIILAILSSSRNPDLWIERIV